MLDYHTIISNMKMLGGAVQETYNVIAVGGTSLVLHGIKGSTEDVDFIVEGGDTMRFEVSYKRYCGGPIDVSAAGGVFWHAVATRLCGPVRLHWLVRHADGACAVCN